MTANLRPLSGKYYGTIVDIKDEALGVDTSFTLWDCGNYEPSDRELEGLCTIEEWRENKIMPSEDNEWYPDGIPARELCEICDSHFESRATYALAVKIIKALEEI